MLGFPNTKFSFVPERTVGDACPYKYIATVFYEAPLLRIK